MRKIIYLFAFIFTLSLSSFSLVIADTTIVPGHNRSALDSDNNNYPDVGVVVSGHYNSLYAYDGNGEWFWDLGDGRVQGSVDSYSELDQLTITRCEYVVNYRGKFENTPFLDSGWIQNLINCAGYDDNNQYNYLIVHESDPRYQGDPAWAVWGNWEYHTLLQSHDGNLISPMNYK